jgi:hypothetical protein
LADPSAGKLDTDEEEEKKEEDDSDYEYDIMKQSE